MRTIDTTLRAATQRQHFRQWRWLLKISKRPKTIQIMRQIWRTRFYYSWCSQQWKRRQGATT